MTGVISTEVYRGPEGHIVRDAAIHFTQYRAVTAIESRSRIYASRQGALNWLRKMEAKRQAKNADAIAREKALILRSRELFASQFKK